MYPDRAPAVAFLCPAHGPLVICLVLSFHHRSDTLPAMSSLWQPFCPPSQPAQGAARPPAGPDTRTSPSPLCQPCPRGRAGNVPSSNHNRPFAALRCPLGFELKKRRIRNTQQHFNANNLFHLFQHGTEPHSRKKDKIVSCCLDNACKNKRQ